MGSYHHPKIKLRQSPLTGTGLFASGAIAKGELLVVTSGRVISTEQIHQLRFPRHPFQIEREWLLAPTDEQAMHGIFSVNHSCEPNAGIRGQVSLVALRDILEGEEICYDYVMTDSDPDGVETCRMECLCGTATCRSVITDLDWRDPSLQAKWQGFFSSYLGARIHTPS